MARALRVSKSIVVRCDAKVLFEAVSTARGLTRWYADRASADLVEGQPVEFVWGKGATAHRCQAKVLRVTRGKSVMLRWEDNRAHSRDDYFSISLEKRKGGVKVTVVDFATKDTQEELEEIWVECLAKLKQTLEEDAQ